MNKKGRIFGPVLAGFLAVVVLATCITPVFAVTYTEHASVVGKTGVFNLPGGFYQTSPTADPIPIPVEITVAHYDEGDHGVRDNIMVYFVRPPSTQYPSGYRVHVAWYSDTAESSELNAAIMYNPAQSKPFPTLIDTLKPWQLQICKIGKTVIAWWTVPLVVPSQIWSGNPVPTPPITIPSGCLILRGYGDSQSSSVPGTGRYTSVWTESYDACGFLMCPSWRRQAFVELNTPGDTKVYFDRTYTANV